MIIVQFSRVQFSSILTTPLTRWQVIVVARRTIELPASHSFGLRGRRRCSNWTWKEGKKRKVDERRIHDENNMNEEKSTKNRRRRRCCEKDIVIDWWWWRFVCIRKVCPSEISFHMTYKSGRCYYMHFRLSRLVDSTSAGPATILMCTQDENDDNCSVKDLRNLIRSNKSWFRF